MEFPAIAAHAPDSPAELRIIGFVANCSSLLISYLAPTQRDANRYFAINGPRPRVHGAPKLSLQRRCSPFAR